MTDEVPASAWTARAGIASALPDLAPRSPGRNAGITPLRPCSPRSVTVVPCPGASSSHLLLSPRPPLSVAPTPPVSRVHIGRHTSVPPPRPCSFVGPPGARSIHRRATRHAVSPRRSRRLVVMCGCPPPGAPGARRIHRRVQRPRRVPATGPPADDRVRLWPARMPNRQAKSVAPSPPVEQRREHAKPSLVSG